MPHIMILGLRTEKVLKTVSIPELFADEVPRFGHAKTRLEKSY